MLAQCVHFGFHIGEVSCPTKYFEEASSINFRRSVKYGFWSRLRQPCNSALERWGLVHFPRFKASMAGNLIPATLLITPVGRSQRGPRNRPCKPSLERWNSALFLFIFLPGQESQDLAGDFVRKSKPRLSLANRGQLPPSYPARSSRLWSIHPAAGQNNQWNVR